MSYLIKDLISEEKPREKALKYGFKSLTDIELLAIILRTGTKNVSAIDLSRTIINQFGSLYNLKNARLENLKKINGVGKVKAITILSCLELGKRFQCNNIKELVQIKESKDVYNYFRFLFFNSDQEIFYTLFLNSKNEVINKKKLFIGTANQSLVHPRDIFKEAMLNNAVRIICLHNHPSGNVLPSLADELFTKKIKEIAKMVGISLLDHVIIGRDKYFSFLENRKDIWK